MAKICFMSDWHAHNHGEFAKTIVYNGKPINSRLYDLLQTIRRVAMSAHKRGCTHLVILGDVFHLRGQIPTDVMQYTYELLQYIKSDLYTEIIIMTGNHDQADREGQIHSIYALQGVASIIDTPTLVELDGLNLHLVPYTPSHQTLLSQLDYEVKSLGMTGYRKKLPSVLCLHAGIDGSMVGSMEYLIKDPITLEDLPTDKFDQLLLGHYHKPQTLAPNVRYVGSPVQHTRSEMGDTKRWIMWDEGNIRSIKTGGKQFFALNSSELESCDFLPGYYDVTIDDEQTPAMIQEVFLSKGNECTVKIASAKKLLSKKARIKVDATTSDSTLLKKYIKHTGTDLDQEQLRTMGLSYLGKATNNQTAKTSLLFNRLLVKNFLSIEHAELNLIRPGEVIAVMGENDAVDSFKSNGSGKSTLLPESIYWCLFGVTARGLPADKVVNNIKKRDCYVRLSMLCDETHVVVERYRKHSELGTGMTLMVNNVDVSQGKVADTEKMLWQMLGLDYTTFSSIVAFSPENLHFVSSTDADQKRVLDSILQTSRFGAALDLVKADVKESKTLVQSLSLEREKAKGSAEALKTNLADYKTASAAFAEREEKRIRDLKASLRQEQESLKEAHEAMASSQKELDKVSKVLADHVVPDVEGLLDMQAMLNKSLGGLQAEAKQNTREQDSLQKQLTAAADQAGQPCPTCGQIVNNTSKLMANLSTQRNLLVKRGESLQVKLSAVQGQLDQLDEELAEYRVAKTKHSELERSVRGLQQQRNADSATVVRLMSTVDSLQKQLNTPATNEYESKLIPEAKTRLKDVKTKIAELEVEQGVAEAELLLMNYWIQGFGNSGVKSFLFDQIIPELTEYANYYADRLTGDTITVEFSTYTEGGAKDKFSIKAFNSEGSDLYAGNSSGERRRIDLCVMLALFRVANNRVKLSILLMDEVFDTLDSVGIETVVNVIDELAKDLDLTIFVTSHTNLSNMLHEHITIRKQNGLATLMEVEDE